MRSAEGHRSAPRADRSESHGICCSTTSTTLAERAAGSTSWPIWSEPERKPVGSSRVAATQWLPPLLRLALASSVTAIFLALPQAWSPPPWVALFAGWGLPLPTIWAIVAVILLLLGGVLVLFGTMGRLAAFWLVFPIGFDMVTRGLTWASGLGLATAVCLMLLGTGPLSRWKPEERFLLRRAGEGK